MSIFSGVALREFQKKYFGSLKSFGLTMAFAIAVSLLVSFTITPALSARMFRG